VPPTSADCSSSPLGLRANKRRFVNLLQQLGGGGLTYGESVIRGPLIRGGYMCRTKIAVVSALVAYLLASTSSAAASRQRMRVLNVSIQPIFTLVSAAIQGHLRSRDDVARIFAAGAFAVYGFYAGKDLTGQGHVRTGFAIANFAASVARNAAAGRPAFSRLGLSVGQLRVDASTPFDSDRTTALHVQASVSETVALMLMWRKSDRLVWRDGRIAFRSNRRYRADNRQFSGYTIGMFSGTTNHATPTTWDHESIHAIQSVQADSVEPPACFWLRAKCRSKRVFEFITWDPVQLGVLPAVGGGALSLQDYTKRWTEIEATWLADRHRPE